MPLLDTIKGRLVFLVGMLVLLMAGLVVISVANLGVRSVSEMRETNVRLHEDTLLVEWEEKAKAVTALLAAQSVQPVSALDYFVLNSNARLVLEGRDVSHVYILDNTGRVLSDGTETLESVGTVLSDAISKRAIAANEILIQRQADIIDVSSPVELGSARLATVRIGFSTNRLNEAIQRLNVEVGESMARMSKETVRNTLLWALLVSLSVLAFGYVFVGRAVSSPLGELVRAARKIGSGDLSHRLDVGSTKNELGELGATFNEMVEQLRETTVSRDYVDNIVGSMSNALVVVTPEGRIETVNNAALDLLGYAEEELKDQRIGLIIADEEEEEEKEEEESLFRGSGLAELVRKGSVDNVEKTYLTKDGRRIPVLFSGSVTRDDKGAIRGIICVAADISELKQTEEALRDSEMRHRAFAADVAHELRTPLSALNLQLEGLEDTEAARTLRRDVDSMSRLVEQLLALARLDTLAVGVDDEADLHAVCMDVATRLAPLAIKEERSIEVVGKDGPVKVRGNSDALKQAVRNLVENAIKYSARGTTVTIKVSEDAQVSVIDQGQGVPEEKRKEIFQRFLRSDQRAGGSGLGLSIVHRTVEAHGGSIVVSDTPGGGATFTISFANSVY